MTDREAFEAWLQQPDSNGSGVTNLVYCRLHSIDLVDVWHGWQAALASERAKQSATTNVGIDWANPATLNGSAPPADDEAVRLLIRALGYVGADRELRKKITAYLARVVK